MKKLSVLCIGIIVVACLFVNCGKKAEKGETAKSAKSEEKAMKSATKAFGDMKSGAWVEYTTPEGSVQKMKYFEDTWEGKECYIIETESQGPQMLSTNQSWVDKSTGKGVIFLTKLGDKVMRVDIKQAPTETTDIPERFRPGSDVSSLTNKIGEDKYTTPTGKTVKVVKYKVSLPTGASVESWASDEVPFKNVQVISDGAITLALRDFGNSGAERAITKQEAETAQPFSMPGGMPGGMPRMPPSKRTPGNTGQ